MGASAATVAMSGVCARRKEMRVIVMVCLLMLSGCASVYVENWRLHYGSCYVGKHRMVTADSEIKGIANTCRWYHHGLGS